MQGAQDQKHKPEVNLTEALITSDTNTQNDKLESENIKG